MNALIIYDSSGKIWNVTYGEDTLPVGLNGIVTDVPEGCSVFGVDLSGSEPIARFEELPGTELDHISKKIDDLSEGVNQLITGSVAPISLACGFLAENFTDEQAVQVPSLYKSWSPEEVRYKAGERVRYINCLYKVLQDHTSQEGWIPELSPSLFAKILIPDPDMIPEWELPSSENAYMTGDKVKHKNETWESLVDYNVWEPGADGTESIWMKE